MKLTTAADPGTTFSDTGESGVIVKEFKSILANPGIDPLSPMYPLARLGLARAYAREGRSDDSRSEYREFLASVDHADPGLHVVLEGRREFERLGEPKN